MNLEEWKDHLENWFYNYHQQCYPDDTPTFTEWFDSLTNSEVIWYLDMGRELYEEWKSEQ